MQVLDRSQTLPMSCDPSAPEPDEDVGRELRGDRNNKVCVRDVSWHPQVCLWNTHACLNDPGEANFSRLPSSRNRS